MKLVLITIKNFRCIENREFAIEDVDGGYTFTLIGINESGKSSFLAAVALFNSEQARPSFPADFYDAAKSVEIILEYQLGKQDEKIIRNYLLKNGFTEGMIKRVKVGKVEICAEFQPGTDREFRVVINVRPKCLTRYTLVDGVPVSKRKKGLSELGELESFNLEEYFKHDVFSEFFLKGTHRIIFWKAESKYLIDKPIDLQAFYSDPENTSVPLFNCYALAKEKIELPQLDILLNSAAEAANLAGRLGDKVTAHIRKVWPDHKIEIKFHINNHQLSFLVGDTGDKNKLKTIGQRSDGFKHFISFILTVSAESMTDRLTNSLLLLDEPETHLHPQAQEYFKNELIKITKNKRNNIVFFATHSPYMMDREHIERCFEVRKKSGRTTELKRFDGHKISYAEVNYKVFKIASPDYHNELYGYLELNSEDSKDELEKTEPRKKWKRMPENGSCKDGKDVSLSKYIRNSIHHPENKCNKKFTQEELRKSIVIMQKLIAKTTLKRSKPAKPASPS